MLKPCFKYLPYMVIIKGIINGFTLSARSDKPGRTQNAQLMRNGTLAHIQMLCKVEHTHFALNAFAASIIAFFAPFSMPSS